MADLRKELNELHFENIKTLLNSGNVLFDTNEKEIHGLEEKIEKQLAKSFGFPIPVILKKRNELIQLVDKDPFKNISVHKDIRLYVSFLKHSPANNLPLPYTTKDNAFKILSVENKTIISVLDLSVSSTTIGMEELEKHFGKNITTRNWNTIGKITKL